MSTFLQVLLGSVVVFGLILLLVGVGVRWVFRRTRTVLSSRLRSAGPARRAVAAPAAHRAAGASPRVSAVLGRAGRSSASLRVRAVLPSRSRQVALVRCGLRDDVRGAAQAVSVGREARRPVQGLQTVMAGLSEQARALDVDLAVIGHEPDRRVRQALLGAQQERLELLRRACGEVRRAVLLSGSLGALPLLRSIEHDLDDEVVALALRADAYAELTGR